MRYTVCYGITGSGSVEIEANSPKEAISKAMRSAGPSLCHECSREISDPEIDPDNISVFDETGEQIYVDD
jgi:hypothetical protein